MVQYLLSLTACAVMFWPLQLMAGSPSCGEYLEEYTKKRNITRPPRRIPGSLVDSFTLSGLAKLETYYVDDTLGGNGTHYQFDTVEIEAMVQAATKQLAQQRSGSPNRRLRFLDKVVGDALNHFASEVSGTSAVIFGSTSPWYEAMVLASGAHSVVTIDYNRLSYQHPKIVTAIPSQILPLIPREHGGFDVAFSISSFDHSGLGRFGDPLDATGDLKAMQTTLCMLKPGGLLFLAVPIGPDCVAFNLHRVYGKHRLPLLLEGFEILSKFGWDESFMEKRGNFRKSYEPIFVLRKPVPKKPLFGRAADGL